MINFFKKLYFQYFICKHEKYILIRKIYSGFKFNFPVFFDKRKCKECNRIYYSDYYVIIKNKKEYLKINNDK